MQLEKVIIEGFRSYTDRRAIDIGQLTALIGANDIGKSTVLEALDAFFNDVADVQDKSTLNEGKEFTIGCVFSGLPATINLDAGAETTLSAEYLLNANDKLEIYKVWKCTATKAEVERIYARSRAPGAAAANNLLFKKRDELRVIVDEMGLEANKARNPDMRAAIYGHLEAEGRLELQDQEIDLDRPKDKTGHLEDARKIWKKLKDRHLPVYSLFKSEHVRGDKETAVRSPLDATLKAALKELEDELAPLAEQVEQKVRDTTKRTLDRLKRDYPEVAKNLVPDYKPPSWSKAFDLDVLRGDDDVPLNKRGAGVRRLVVLAFFQAEAEKRRRDRADGPSVPPVIYAVEEPETSQHPDFQRTIISALQALADAGDQVLVTTHVPGLAELLPTHSIRFIDRVEGSTTPRIRNGGESAEVLQEAAQSLGVLPSAIPVQGAQVAVWVEGKSDVWVLDAFVQRFGEAGSLPEGIDQGKIYYVIGESGDKLKAFINGEYLAALGLPQFYLLDSDKEAADHDGKPVPQEVTDRIAVWENRKEGPPMALRRTRKREIENYLDPGVIGRVVGQEVRIEDRLEGLDWDFAPISKQAEDFWSALRAVKDEEGFQFPTTRRRGVELKHIEPKHVICGILIPEMSADEIRARCRSTDEEGAAVCEIEEWFQTMAQLIAHARGAA